MRYKHKQRLLVSLVLVILMSFVIIIGLSGDTSVNQVSDDQNLSDFNLPILGYVAVEIDGAPIDGEVSAPTYGQVDVRFDHIEFYSFRHDMRSAVEESSGELTGAVQHYPIYITKQIDKSTPLMIQALNTNQPTEAVFKFFGIDPDTNQTTLTYTINIQSGVITSVRTVTVIDGGQSFMLEEVSFVYQTITFTDQLSGEQYTDSWSGN